MARHSKNNTSNSVFSYAEYRKLDSIYGTKRQRLGMESMRDRLSCSLCLQRAREPTACADGHLYCKECIYADLLEQKKDIKRHQAKLEAAAAEEEVVREKARQAARDRVLKEFEERQLGLGSKRKSVAVAEKDLDNVEGMSYGSLESLHIFEMTLKFILSPGDEAQV